MTALAFVDTNLLIHSRDSADASRHAMARAWLDLLWRDRTGRISAQVLSEYFNVATRKPRPAIDPEDAWGDVQELMPWNPVATDGDLLTEAWTLQRRYRINWWDALIVAAAIRQGCGVLLSEDFQDGMQFGPVRVMNPFTHRVGEHAAVYAALPRAAALHRGRGRPKRRTAA